MNVFDAALEIALALKNAEIDILVDYDEDRPDNNVIRVTLGTDNGPTTFNLTVT